MSLQGAYLGLQVHGLPKGTTCYIRLQKGNLVSYIIAIHKL